MTDYTDIVRRLRAAADARSTTRIDVELFLCAADTIEALEKERDEARAVARRATDEWAVLARVAELEGLIRSRCEHCCLPWRNGRGAWHAPECLVEEAGL